MSEKFKARVAVEYEVGPTAKQLIHTRVGMRIREAAEITASALQDSNEIKVHSVSLEDFEPPPSMMRDAIKKMGDVSKWAGDWNLGTYRKRYSWMCYALDQAKAGQEILMPREWAKSGLGPQPPLFPGEAPVKTVWDDQPELQNIPIPLSAEELRRVGSIGLELQHMVQGAPDPHLLHDAIIGDYGAYELRVLAMFGKGCKHGPPKECDEVCAGWFLDGDSDIVVRCDTCGRFEDDNQAFDHVQNCVRAMDRGVAPPVAKVSHDQSLADVYDLDAAEVYVKPKDSDCTHRGYLFEAHSRALSCRKCKGQWSRVLKEDGFVAPQFVTPIMGPDAGEMFVVKEAAEYDIRVRIKLLKRLSPEKQHEMADRLRKEIVNSTFLGRSLEFFEVKSTASEETLLKPEGGHMRIKDLKARHKSAETLDNELRKAKAALKRADRAPSHAVTSKEMLSGIHSLLSAVVTMSVELTRLQREDKEDG